MQSADHLIDAVLTVILIVGAYQFYFLTQRHHRIKARTFHSKIDEKIPYWPIWSLIYSLLYYPAILYLNWVMKDARQFNLVAFSFILLLFTQMGFFYFFPVSTPDHWRSPTKGNRYSERFLKFAQKYDAPTNCFPSMHVSVAMLTALYAADSLGPWAYLFPVLISLSCVFTKQHYLIDLPFGAALGWLAYQTYFVLV